MSGIVNAIIMVGGLALLVYGFMHKDELFGMLNGIMGGGGAPAPSAAPSGDAPIPDKSAPTADAPGADTADSADPTTKEKDSDKMGKNAVEMATGKTDKKVATKKKTPKCKKGQHYDSKKKKCVPDKKKSHMAVTSSLYARLSL